MQTDFIKKQTKLFTKNLCEENRFENENRNKKKIPCMFEFIAEFKLVGRFYNHNLKFIIKIN